MSGKNSGCAIAKVSTTDAPAAAGPYSQAIKATTIAGAHIWVSGQIPMDLSGTPIEGTITEKTRLCCQNVKTVLEAAGVGLERVVRVGVFLTSMDHFQEMNAEYEKWFTHLPARSCVAVYQLPKGVPVEIEAVAIQ